MLKTVTQLLRMPSYAFVIAFVIAVTAFVIAFDREISLPFIEPHVERLASQEFAGAQVQVDGLKAKIDFTKRRLALRVGLLKIEGIGDAPDTELREIGAEFLIADLLEGRFDPLGLRWGEVKFGIVADPTGNLSFGLNPTPGGTVSSKGSMPFFLSQAYASAPSIGTNTQVNQSNTGFAPLDVAQFTRWPWIESLFASIPSLDNFVLGDSDLSYKDMRTGFGIETRGANIRFKKLQDGKIDLQLDGPVAVGMRKADASKHSTKSADWSWDVMQVNIHALVSDHYRLERFQIETKAVIPDAFLPLFPDNEFLKSLPGPFDLSVGMRFEKTGALRSVSGTLIGVLDENVLFSIRPNDANAWRVEVLAENINPSDEPVLLEAFDFLAMLDAPFSGSNSMLFDAYGNLQIYQLGLQQNQSGTLNLPDVWSKPIPFRNAAISIQGDETTSDVITSGLEISDGTNWYTGQLTSNIQTTMRGTRIAIDLHSNQTMPSRSVASLWPDVPPDDIARDWFLDNVFEADVLSPSIQLQMVSNDPKEQLEIEGLQSSFGFRDAQVQITPALGTAFVKEGRVRIENDLISVTARQGSLGPTKGSDLTMSLDFSDTEQSFLEMQVNVQSDIVPGAQWLANAEVGLKHLESALPLDKASGHLSGRFSSTIPLADNKEQFNFMFTGNLSHYRLESFFNGQDIVGENASLTSDINSTHLSGTVSLGNKITGYNSHATTDLAFTHENQLLTLRGRFESTVEAVRPFIAGLANFGGGKINGQYNYRGQTNTGQARIDLATDLTEIEVDLPFIFYNKPQGRKASAVLGIELEKNTPIRVPQFNVVTSQSEALGSVQFYPNQPGKFDIQFDTLKIQETKLSQVNMAIENGGQRIDVSAVGGVIDATGAVDKLFGGTRRQTNSQGNVAKRQDGFGLAPDVVIVVRAHKIERVLLPESKFFNNVTASISIQNNSVEHMRFTGKPPSIYHGRAPNVGVLNASIEPIKGGYTFALDTDDAGAVFYATNINQSIRKGNIQIKAYSPLAFPHGGWSGTLRASEVVVVNAPLFGQLLQVASLTGIGELLSGRGLSFNEVRADFTYSPGNIHIDKGEMLGPSIGLTGQGGINFWDRNIEVIGTVTPLGTLNEITQQLPMLDMVLNGLDGGGLFSATYSVSGRFDRPDIYVNPWTSLTPGVFRDLYRAVTGSF